MGRQVDSDLNKLDMEAIATALQEYLFSAQRFLDQHPQETEEFKQQVHEKMELAKSAQKNFSSFSPNVKLGEIRLAYSCLYDFRRNLVKILASQKTPEKIRTSALRMQQPAESAFTKLRTILVSLGDNPADYEAN